MNTKRILHGCALGLALALACSEGAPEPEPERELVVFGAASLREAFDALGQELQATHRGVQVHATYAGSQALRAQIEQGARADVIAAAAAEELAPLVAAKRLGELKLLAHN